MYLQNRCSSTVHAVNQLHAHKKLPILYYIWLELKYTFYANLTCHLLHLHLCKFGMRAGRRVGTSKAWKGLTVWQLEVAT